MGDESDDKNKKWKSPNRPYPQERAEAEAAEDMKLWGVFLFGLIGATATTFAVGQLRRTVDWLYSQLTRSQSSWRGRMGGSFRSTFQEEARKRCNRRMQEEHEEEMERVERIRRMQSVFNRARNNYKRSYDSWTENNQGQYHQHFQRDDWYWKTDTSFRDKRTNFRTPRESAYYPLSHHYSVLGLDRSRTTPYTEAEIKNAFRAKAKEFHPDQNQNNKDTAEAKFKEVMISYEAIKQERKDMRR